MGTKTAETSKITRIDIGLPLPLETVSALTNAIGAMWPEAAILSGGHSLSLTIPNRRAKRVTQRTFKDILAGIVTGTHDEAPEVFLERWNRDGPTLAFDSKDEAWQTLAAWAVICLTADFAPNYVEQRVVFTDADDTCKQLVLTCAWSPDQTPHKLRKDAERKAAGLQSRLEAATAETDRLRAEVERLQAELDGS